MTDEEGNLPSSLIPSVAVYSQIPPPSSMNTKGNLAENWKYFKKSWNNYKLATGLDKKANNVVLATLYTILGREANQIAENLEVTDPTDPDSLIEALSNYFEPQKNTIFERYLFNTAVQEDNESIDQYLNRLRKLAATCEYGTLTSELIRDRLVIGISEHGIRSRLLREKTLTLDSAVNIVRAAERSKSQLKQIERHGESPIHSVRDKGIYNKKKFETKTPVMCKYCGKSHKRRECPAFGQVCRKCQKKNHFAKVCKSAMSKKDDHREQRHNKPRKKIHQVGDIDLDPDSEDDLYSPTYAFKGVKQYMVQPEIKATESSSWKEVKMQIDNGAAANCLKLENYNQMANPPELKKSNVKLTTYSGSRIIPEGQVTVDIRIGGQTLDKVIFQVIKDAPCSLLSGPTSEALGLIKVKDELLVNAVADNKELTEEDVLTQYKDVFTGLGHIGDYKIELKEGAIPKQDPPRSVPVALRDELKAKLDELVKQEILTKVEEPTDWVNSAVYVKKPGKLRVCLDPKELNKHIRIPKFRMPTMEDVITKLGKVKVFTVLDAKDGFLQVKLHEESTKLTTFHTPFGRYKWLRMPFGISSAPEEFQRLVHDVIGDLDGVETIADDLLVYGSGDSYEEAVVNHDQHLISLLDRCRERNLKLNKSKLRFKQKSVKYNGHILTTEGMLPDPAKVEAITEMPRPRDKAEVRRLLGMVNYLGKFLQQLSDVSEPLRNLTKEGVKFIWSQVHEDTFNKLKRMISQPPVLQYYDLDEEITLETDASDYGLGAVLLQKGRPVAFASRTLTQSEKRYSQIEKECLSIVFGCTRFDHYLHGRKKIKALTDHKPLETILAKSINSAPKRLQRMMLRLQKYRLDVAYQKGSRMYISDHLSRSPFPTNQKDSMKADDYDIFAVNEENQLMKDIEEIDPNVYHNVTDKTLKKVADATTEDENLLTLATLIMYGWPSDKIQVPFNVREYWPYRDELSIQDGIIYRGTRVLIPTAMRPRMLEQIHCAHLGAERCIRAARDSLYWPTIHNDIKYLCDNCQTCQEYKPEQTKQPMQSQPIPKRRWQYVSTDLFSVKKDTYVIVVDNLTKYWDVEELTETSAQTTILQTKKIFSRHGVPEFVISDNGPQYTSGEYKKFSEEWNFQHHTSSPHYPKGNGTAEAAVKQAKRILKLSNDPWLAILEVRNTPDELASPNEKLMSRRTRTTLPIKSELLEPSIVPIKSIIQATIKKKQQNKRYYDRVSKPLPPLVVGENIRSKIKPSSSPCWSRGTVVSKQNDRSYIVETDGRQYRRDRFHIRKARELKSNVPNLPAEHEILPQSIIPPAEIPSPPQCVEPLMSSPKTVCVSSEDRDASSQKPPNIPPEQFTSSNLRRSGRIRKPNPKYKDCVSYLYN